MIATFALLGLLSAAFFVAWQYTESTLLIAAYVLSVTGVCVVNRLLLRQSERRVLRRFEQILGSGECSTAGRSDCIADENLSATERRMISRLCELEAREERVRQGFQNISSLVSDISHQCKTPLSSILMYTELSRDHGDIVIHRQTEKLQFLIESLTKLAKCEGGLIAENLSPRMNSVRELVARSVESVIDAADRRGISIVCNIGGAEVNGARTECADCVNSVTDRTNSDTAANSHAVRNDIVADSHTDHTHTDDTDLSARFDLRWTAEALANILDNAVKYSPDGGEIRVKTCDRATFVRIDVADHGRGIPESELCNIWKRFWRGKNSRDLPGVGVGLYLTSRILSAEGGRAVARPSPDGSTFSVFLSKL